MIKHTIYFLIILTVTMVEIQAMLCRFMFKKNLGIRTKVMYPISSSENVSANIAIAKLAENIIFKAIEEKDDKKYVKCLHEMRTWGWKIKDSINYTPLVLHYAVNHDLPKITEELLLHDPNLVEAQDCNGFTPLYYAKSLYITDMLLKANANVNAENQLGYSPLYTVPYYVARLLLENGADMHLESKRRLFVAQYRYTAMTPFRYAALKVDALKFQEYTERPIDISEYFIVLAIMKLLQQKLENLRVDNQHELTDEEKKNLVVKNQNMVEILKIIDAKTKAI